MRKVQLPPPDQEDDPTLCWIWIGASKAPKKYPERRYPLIDVQGKNKAAHRVVYEYYIGPIPPNYHIERTCGNLMCVRPEHLVAKPRHVVLQNSIRRYNNPNRLIRERRWKKE